MRCILAVLVSSFALSVPARTLDRDLDDGVVTFSDVAPEHLAIEMIEIGTPPPARRTGSSS